MKIFNFQLLDKFWRNQCLSEATQILVNPNLATLNSRSETYGFCRHRKKYLLKNVKPLALKGGALTYRYKD